MVAVAILRRSARSSKNTGVDIYAKMITDVLNESGIEGRTVEMTMDLKNGPAEALINGMIRPAVELFRMRKSVDVFHATDDFCCLLFPFIRGRKVMTFHHVVSDKDKDLRLRSLWKIIAKIGVLWSDRIIAISEQTKKEIISTYNVNEDRITVIPHRVTASFKTLGIQKKRYIGCVSTLIPRKNIQSLVRTFKILSEMKGAEDYTLRICGKGPDKEAIEEQAEMLGIREKVQIISDLSEEELILFYNQAKITANPSLHEGFGNATLESQKCSTPVVFFKDADIPEEVTKHAVSASDENDFALKMYELISDQKAYDKVVRAGKEYADAFGNDFDERLMTAYELK